MKTTIYFAVGDTGAHNGFVTSRTGEPWPAPDGWTYQDVTGAHGTVIHEGTEAECEAALAEFLRCDAPSAGRYCYTHNPVRD